MMKYVPLVWAGLWRKPVRILLTVLSITIAFLLFGLLTGITAGLEEVIGNMATNRVGVAPETRGDRLPAAYASQIERLANVTSVVTVSSLPLYYREPRNRITNAALGGSGILGAAADIEMPSEQLMAYERTRAGALIGRRLAQEYGWKIGDRLSLLSTVRQRDRSNRWEFEVVGIFDSKEVFISGQLWYHYEYLEESRVADKGTVNLMVVHTADAAHNDTVAEAIDQLFASSANPTVTQNDREWQRAGIKRTLDIQLMVTTVVATSLFTLLLLTGNSMMQSVRQRIPEFAVLRTVGYSDAKLLGLIFVEAAAPCVLGAVLGLAIARGLFPLLADAVGLSGISMPLHVVTTGMLIAMATAICTASIPALVVQRSSVVGALANRQ